MKEQERYWDKFILDWDGSVYNSESRKLNFVEKIATRFRGALRDRHAFALENLRQVVAGRSLIELGCGTGRFSFDLFQAGAAHVSGVDISAAAVRSAQARLAEGGALSNQYNFVSNDIAGLEADFLVKADFVVGLGVLQYLSDTEIDSVLSRCRPETLFFFDFHEASMTTTNLLHWVYRLLKKMSDPDYPPYRTMTRSFIRKRFAQAGFKNLHHIRADGICFFTNIEDLNTSRWTSL